MKGRYVRVAALGVIALIATVGAGSVFSVAAAEAQPQKAISREDAISDARKALPNNGSGYDVLKTELEPDSTHFNFTNANGSGSFGEDGVQECLIIPPIPIVFGCRPYPVWVIELAGPSCEATIAINAYSGRFGGGATDGCDLVPEVGAPPVMFVARWQ